MVSLRQRVTDSIRAGVGVKVKILVVVAAVLVVVGVALGLAHRPKPAERVDPHFESDLAAFRREASILNSLTEYGVAYPQFSEQLAKTSAAFDLLQRSPSLHAEQALKFYRPIDTWSLANRVWKRKIARGERYLWHTGEDLGLLNEVMDRCGYARMTRDEDGKTSIDSLVRSLLTTAGEDYKRAMETPP
jgi:hypothetical protein